MRLRAFVVMPFGTQSDAGKSVPQIDFESVWAELIRPALESAGCEAVRADSQVSAGDIRTDMFFELVTADVVVADLSIPNPNVYYELGIRDGICSHGVFIVEGGWLKSRPFDLASDRSFRYQGKLFQLDEDHKAQNDESKKEIEAAKTKARKDEATKLAAVFSRALASDSQVTGSPVYSHLPGLKPANWEEIDTSRARYFGSLQSDWQDRVRRAQELNRPGHILTIAQYAPTRVHRTKILLDAARALIGLEQFATAEEVLDEVLQVTPDNSEAQLYLALAQINGEDILRAERQLRKMLQLHKGDPQASMALGFVYRLLWYLEWKDDANPVERAKASPRLLIESIHRFYDVQTRHPSTDNRKRVPLPVELSPDRCKAASDMPAGIAPFMIVKEVFDFFNDVNEP